MRKDTTEFRQRFQRWKNGEQVYDKGKILPHYRTGLDGEDDTVPSDNTRVVNPRLLTAEKIVDLPTAFELARAKHEAEQIGPTPNISQQERDLGRKKYETQQWVQQKKILEQATDEMMKTIIDPRYAALGFGLGQIARAAGSVINAGKNLYKGYKVSRAIDKTGSKINIVKPDDFSFEFRPGSNTNDIQYSVFDRILGKPKKDLLKFQQYTENAKAATPESVESAFKTRKDLYSGKWETGEYREPIAASRKSNADFVEKYINEELRPKYPNATEDELRGAIFRESTGNTIEDVMGANGFVYRNDAGRLVHAQYTNNSAAPVRSTLSKLHEANHTSFYFDEHRIDNKIMQRLKTPEGEKTFFKESAGVKSPNFDNPSPNEFYLDADETTTYLSEAANLLGKTTPWTAQELQWLSNNLSVLSPIKNYSVYRDLFNRVFDYKKFAKAIKGLMYSSAATLTIPTINE